MCLGENMTMLSVKNKLPLLVAIGSVVGLLLGCIFGYWEILHAKNLQLFFVGLYIMTMVVILLSAIISISIRLLSCPLGLIVGGAWSAIGLFLLSVSLLRWSVFHEIARIFAVSGSFLLIALLGTVVYTIYKRHRVSPGNLS